LAGVSSTTYPTVDVRQRLELQERSKWYQDWLVRFDQCQKKWFLNHLRLNDLKIISYIMIALKLLDNGITVSANQPREYYVDNQLHELNGK